MSLLKRNKDKQLAAEKKLAARHAIVKIGVDRNVRDAYFQGLGFINCQMRWRNGM